MMASDIPAILDGDPIFDKPYHLVRPILPPSEEVIEGLQELFKSRMFTNQGIFARTLEDQIAEKNQVKHCALFCNGTTAIMCLVQAMGLKGEILVPSFTFAATTQALLWQRLGVRFVDIRRDTLTMDPEKIEEAITQEVAAIFPVHIFGGCCDHDAILEIAQRHGLPLIYDAAQAFETRYRGKPVGSLGEAAVFSFHATKIFHTGEGGAVVTDNTRLYEALCKIRNFGFEGYLNCTDLGINGKMSEFSALIGLKLLDQLPSHIEKRRWVFQNYRDNLKSIRGIVLPEEDPDVDINYSYFYVMIDAKQFGLTSIELNYALIAERIITRCYFYPPVHRTAFYRELLQNQSPVLPETDWAAMHVLCLPVYSDMQSHEFTKIIEGIVRCQKYAGKIKSKITRHVPSDWNAITSGTFKDPYDRFILNK